MSAGSSIVQAYSVGLPVLPAASVASTSKVCWPSANSVNSLGEAHSANGALSREHSNFDPSSSAEKVNVATVSVVEAGGSESMVTCGAVVSTIHVWLTGDSTLPAASVA